MVPRGSALKHLRGGGQPGGMARPPAPGDTGGAPRAKAGDTVGAMDLVVPTKELVTPRRVSEARGRGGGVSSSGGREWGGA